ncbi:MAG: hypothetical protein H6719_18795 [Sandaracinaceae bacterium]|nr:hypothetical protein [Sandaracinaceae bacterium]
MSSSIEIALIHVRRGEILEVIEGGGPSERLEGFAAAVPEIFATDRISWELVFGQVRPEAGTLGLEDLVLVSEGYVHVAARLPEEPLLALLTVAPREGAVGLILASARARLESVREARR